MAVLGSQVTCHIAVYKFTKSQHKVTPPSIWHGDNSVNVPKHQQ